MLGDLHSEVLDALSPNMGRVGALAVADAVSAIYDRVNSGLHQRAAELEYEIRHLRKTNNQLEKTIAELVTANATGEQG